MKNTDKILTNLINHKISLKKAKKLLYIDFLNETLKDNSQKALKEAVETVYLNDNSDYLSSLNMIITLLSGIENPNINELFKQLK